jgi:hypothetical protein
MIVVTRNVTTSTVSAVAINNPPRDNERRIQSEPALMRSKPKTRPPCARVWV